MDHRIKTPLGYKIANSLGSILSAVRSPMLSLNESRVCEQAIQASKLTDFGHSYFRKGLTTLLESGTQGYPPLGADVSISGSDPTKQRS
jgi:hypothetical protein